LRRAQPDFRKTTINNLPVLSPLEIHGLNTVVNRSFLVFWLDFPSLDVALHGSLQTMARLAMND